MTRNTQRNLIAALIFVLYLALIVGVAFALHLEAARFWIFTGVLALIGAIATIGIVLYLRKSGGFEELAAAGAADTTNLDALVRSADARMKNSRGAAKSLAAMPLVYVLGDENSAKTQTVLESGLDPELLAGQVHRDGLVAPTQLANIWYTASAVLVEAGGSLLRQPGLWQRLIRLTQPSKLGTALKKGALQPTRAAVLCVSIERLTTANSAESIRAFGKTLNERLRLLSQALGISLPVYVLFTKLDTIPSFSDYIVNLTNDEARQPLGSLLAPPDPGAGLYADRATAQTAERFDELCYSLSEFRLEVLSRGGDAASLARAYEFPRELRKLRAVLVDLLVEIGRPSQLGVNPFLRGFYFSGIRARLIEETVGESSFAAAPQAPPPTADAGATRVFSFSAMQAAPAAPAPAARSGGTRRVPQWVFLPYLFPRIVLADHTALNTSRASTKVNVVKRLLIASVTTCLFLYLIALTVSYFNNSALESRLRAAAAVPMQSTSHGDPASTADLLSLDQLRQVFAQIASYRKDGAPLSYRWGLYSSDRLYRTACAAYGDHFRTLLLTPTQANILTRLTALPAAPAPTDEYIATYRPLKAYLITTVNPDKSSSDFLPSALQDAWAANRQLPSQSTDLSLTQFETYAATLAEPGSCMAPLGGSPHPSEVNQARVYLSHFQGFQQVYLSMKAAADRKFHSIKFNEKFPGSARFVTDPFEVEGAFTKDGYTFMQNAILHPEPYTSGEEWVLGPQTGNAIDRASLNAQLPVQYQADFLSAWRSFLKAAHVVPAPTFADEKDKLHQLDSPSSSLLQLFQVIAQNTAVPNPTFSQSFQAPQSVVPPSAAVLPVGTPYIQALQALEGAINSMLLIPGSQTDPSAVAPVVTAASAAEGTVSTIRGGFTPPDPVGGMDTTSERLLLEPIKAVEALAAAAPGKAAGGDGQALCSQLGPVLGKFPFNPDSNVDAASDEIAKAFAPGQGFVTQYINAHNKLVTLQGSTVVSTPGSIVTLNPAFLRFLNNAMLVSSTFVPPSNAPPQLSFTLEQEPALNLPAASLDIDGTTLAIPGQAKQFLWTSSPNSTIKLNAGGNSNVASGPWSLFHFAFNARHSAVNKLEYTFQVNNRTVTTANGVPLDYIYDVGGTGAQFLNPSFMRTQLRCVAKVAQ
jgi:type VI secretion system protein ImpL